METDDRNRDIKEKELDMFENREYLKKYYVFLFLQIVVFLLSFFLMFLSEKVLGFVMALTCQIAALIAIIATIGIIRNS